MTDLDALGVAGLAFPETGSSQTWGYIHIDDSATGLPSVAMHELFHLVQFGVWADMDPYVLEARAEWAGFRFLGFPLAVDLGGTSPVPLLDTVGLPDMSLTCSGDACGATEYDALGYSRWHFFQYLTERFGSWTVNELFQRGKTVNDPGVLAGDLLVQLLAAKGATLGDVFHDWTVANMTGAYTATGLKGIKPPAYSTTLTGNTSGALATQKIPVNHLAARYVAFRRGTGASEGPCYAATLNLSVTVPAGLGARPVFNWTAAGSPAISLPVSGSTASLSVPWDTCAWSDVGLVSLPNPSANVDAALFTVSGSITVDERRWPPRPPARGHLHRPDRAVADRRGAPVDRRLRARDAPRVEEAAHRAARRLLERHRQARRAARQPLARHARPAHRQQRSSLHAPEKRDALARRHESADVHEHRDERHARCDRDAQARPDEVTSRARARPTGSSSQSPSRRRRRGFASPSRTSSTRRA